MIDNEEEITYYIFLEQKAHDTYELFQHLKFNSKIITLSKYDIQNIYQI